MRYSNKLNYQRRKKFIFRVRLLSTILFCALLSGGGFLYYDSNLRHDPNATNKTTSSETSGFFAPSIKVFRSGYFQFQTGSSWTEVVAETTPNKYVYRSLNGNLIDHELVIYVNQIANSLQPTRLLPVAIKDQGTLEAKNVTGPCTEGIDASHDRTDYRTMTKDNVEFSCYTEGNEYNVIVGSIGGNTALNLTRPDGTNAVYTIYYKNLRATPDASEFYGLISSFQTR